MKKTLYLIRHGQALHNINFIKYGSNTYYNKINLDAPLTAIGDLLGLCNLSVTNRCAHSQGNHFAAASDALWGTNIPVTVLPRGFHGV